MERVRRSLDRLVRSTRARRAAGALRFEQATSGVGPSGTRCCILTRVDVVTRPTSGGDGNRTHYLLHAMQALYQLSYAPDGEFTLPVDYPQPLAARPLRSRE